MTLRTGDARVHANQTRQEEEEEKAKESIARHERGYCQATLQRCW